MKKFRWQILLVLVTGLIVGLILFFAQGKSAPVPEGTPSPKVGGVYTEGINGHLMRLNPLFDHNNGADRDVDRLIFSSLLIYDSQGLPQGDLAESWLASEDGTHYTFNLYPTAVWHDGVALTAHDVAFTVALLQSQSALLPTDLRDLWPQITVNVLSDSSLEFVLPEPFAPFTDYLGFQILPEHLLQGLSVEAILDNPFNLAPVGSGSYRFSALVTEAGAIKGVDLLANEFYYRGRPFIEEFRIRYYSTESDVFAAYQAGEVDGINAITSETLSPALAQMGLNLYSVRQARMSMVFLNLNNNEAPFLQKVDFRKALMATTNRRGMIDELLQGQGVLAQGPILPNSWAFFDTGTSYAYDPDKTNQILASLGMSLDADGHRLDEAGKPIRVSLLVNDDPTQMALATKLQAGWLKAGIQVDLEPVDSATLLARLQGHSYQAALVDLNLSDTPDPDPYPFWAESQIASGQNYSQWRNTTASEYLEQARIQLSHDLRSKFYRNFQVLFAEDLPSLPLYYPVYNYGIKSSILGVSLGSLNNPSARFDQVQSWYILSSTEEATPTEK